MSENSGASGGSEFDAGVLGAQALREAEQCIEGCRKKNDHTGAWKVAKERVGVLLSLGLVETGDPEAAMTFERIVRLASEADSDE